MKAALTDLGVLVITPESPAETFALKQWNALVYAGSEQIDGKPLTKINGDFLSINGVPIQA